MGLATAIVQKQHQQTSTTTTLLPHYKEQQPEIMDYQQKLTTERRGFKRRLLEVQPAERTPAVSASTSSSSSSSLITSASATIASSSTAFRSLATPASAAKTSATASSSILKFISLILVIGLLMLTQNVEMVKGVPMDSFNTRLYNTIHNWKVPQLWHRRVTRDLLQMDTMENSMTTNLLGMQNSAGASLASSSTEITLDQGPKGQCLFNGEYVPENKAFCKEQPGCREIRKTGHCCPDYKCDCQKDGKTYLNGDKLVDPETPCTVCYCQGGEILCSSVTCFHRDDCTPKYIPGVCCPEYDNCPVSTSESSVNKTMATSTTTLKPDAQQQPQAVNNPKITIKEITKPIEIRITDDNKAIPIHQMLKPTTTTTTTTILSTTTAGSTTSAAAAAMGVSTAESSTTQKSTILEESAIKLNNNPASAEKASDSLDKNPASKFTYHAPQETLKLSVSVTYPPTVLGNELMTHQQHSSSTAQPIAESSAEVEDPVPSLSVYGSNNLGLTNDPSKVNIKREYFITTEGALAANNAAGANVAGAELPNSELIYSQNPIGNSNYLGNIATAASSPSSPAELDTDTAGSDNIYHIILTTDGPRLASTSENYLALKGTLSTKGSPFEDLAENSSSGSAASSTEAPVDSSSSQSAAASSINTTPCPEEEIFHKSPSTEGISHQHLDEDDSILPLESNPAYPSLPDIDFSIRDNNFETDILDEPRSIGGAGATVAAGNAGSGMGSSYDETKSNDFEDTSAHYGSGNGMLPEENIMELDGIAASSSPSSISTTEGSGDYISPEPSSTENLGKHKTTPEIIQLMQFSGEDLSAETKIANISDFQVKDQAQSRLETTKHANPSTNLENISEESIELGSGLSMEAGSGSGSGETHKKEREPTTPRPRKSTTPGDIDELAAEGSGNGNIEPEDDPKDDVESLKLDESQNDGSSNVDKSPKNNILAVQIKPQQDKTLEQRALQNEQEQE